MKRTELLSIASVFIQRVYNFVSFYLLRTLHSILFRPLMHSVIFSHFLKLISYLHTGIFLCILI